jgi:flagellin
MNSLSTYNVYKKNIDANASAMERISSGEKINAAKDNPNKIGQSEQMRIQIKSLQASQKNLQDAASMVQTADGALQEVNNTLSRMRDLAVSACDDTKSYNDKCTIQEEMNQLKKNLDDLAYNTEFNGVKMLGNSAVKNNDYPGYKNIVIGIMVDEQSRIPLFNVSSASLKDKNNNILKNIDVSTSDGASSAIMTIDDSINIVSKIRGKYGAIANRFESSAESSEGRVYSIEKADSSLRDADVAYEMMEVSRTKLLNDTSLALIAQSNRIPLDALRVLERV